MKKALIALYIAAVVSISIAARAEVAGNNTVELLGAHYQLTSDQQNIIIQGRYPNVCTNGGQYQIVSENGVVEIQVIANRPHGACAAVLGANYSFSVPLGEIKQQLPSLSLTETAVHTVTSGDRKFAVEVDFSKVQGAPGGFLDVKTMIKLNSSGTPAISMAY